MIKNRLLSYCFIFLISVFGNFNSVNAQESVSKYNVTYQSVLLDSTYAQPIDLTMSTYIEILRSKMGEKLNLVIGYASSDLHRFKPQSPLSNFLTDNLLNFGNSYLAINKTEGTIDLSLLNFGGIRGSILAGNITIENLYQIAPFDNTVVIIDIKGSELKKVFKKFSEKDNAAFSNAQTIYQNGRILSYTVNGEPINDLKIYKMITLDFLQSGGDGYLEGLDFENVIYTGIGVRDVYISQIETLTKAGQKIEGKMDNRVIIKPTP